jgi:hypothetical protein
MGVLARIRQWWTPPRIDPNKPHQYRSIDFDGAVAAGGDSSQLAGGSQVPMLTLATDAGRESCRLPGCGRSPDDPIHI